MLKLQYVDLHWKFNCYNIDPTKDDVTPVILPSKTDPQATESLANDDPDAIQIETPEMWVQFDCLFKSRKL